MGEYTVHSNTSTDLNRTPRSPWDFPRSAPHTIRRVVDTGHSNGRQMDGENRPDGGRSGKHREVDYRHLDGDSSQPSDPLFPLRERYVDENRACSPIVQDAIKVKKCLFGGETYRNKEGWFVVSKGRNKGHYVCMDWDAFCVACFSEEETER